MMKKYFYPGIILALQVIIISFSLFSCSTSYYPSHIENCNDIDKLMSTLDDNYKDLLNKTFHKYYDINWDIEVRDTNIIISSQVIDTTYKLLGGYDHINIIKKDCDVIRDNLHFNKYNNPVPETITDLCSIGKSFVEDFINNYYDYYNFFVNSKNVDCTSLINNLNEKNKESKYRKKLNDYCFSKLNKDSVKIIGCDNCLIWKTKKKRIVYLIEAFYTEENQNHSFVLTFYFEINPHVTSLTKLSLTNLSLSIW